MPAPFEWRGDRFLLRVRLTPKAGRNGIGDIFIDADGVAWLKARVTAVPEDGRANRALIVLISGALGVPRSAITIVAGLAHRTKTLELAGEEARLAALAKLAGSGVD
ncbi:DUF167 family protein [Pseudohoeflea sp. DP4N28-3]|uniref:UPF0235 protein KY465_05780 n=1 Tax=Pseudohoeflea coraliihabitans TaxID=2860393 RepID=A0ABS6WLE8_9HYPH|nr:DUF167 family protein [Pseudohoeflea sp. DP4N28-3]